MSGQPIRRAVPSGYSYLDTDNLPDDWAALIVVDKATNQLVHQVKEVDVTGGWLVRLVDDIPENLSEWPVERIEGQFAILRVVELESTETIEVEKGADDA